MAEKGLLKNKTIGIDATTLEANAALKSIEHRGVGVRISDVMDETRARISTQARAA